MSKELVMNALDLALRGTKSPSGVMHHSNRDSQYASHAYQTLMKRYGIVGSMSRKGNCYDNACMKSF